MLVLSLELNLQCIYQVIDSIGPHLYDQFKIILK